MNSERRSTGYQFGTFKGVFTPSLLTILGVIMYLRLGWVLGQTGLATTLVIVTLASSITFLTGLSLAALATNMKIGGGGAYFIISRSLGLEAGAAIGLPLFLAQALGISFYIAGFSESVVSAYPGLNPQLVGVSTLILLTLLAYVSADLALKAQFLIMALILASLGSFFAGGQPDGAAGLPTAPEVASGAPLPFWVVFAVFFPAVTGIEAGIAMSGDLKNPAKSLPLGTILAVLCGYVVYLAIPIFMFFVIQDNRLLLADPLVMQKVARWGSIVLYGIWAASLSSAMGALLGAPRTLQALARDRVIPRFLGRGFGKGNDPRIATGISFLIGLSGILFGDLNAIAPVLSMFFLTSYGVLNLSAGLEELMGNPSWRPKFRIPAWVSLAGFGACFGVMFMINIGATLVAGVISVGIYYLMKRRSLRARWGDMRLGVMMFLAREILHRMTGRKHDERTWNPNLLVLSGPPAARWYLIDLANAIARGKSFMTVVSVIPENTPAERAESITNSIRDYLQKHEVEAFVRAFPATDPLTGAQALINAYGFGPIIPNTLMLGETEKAENFINFARLVQLMHRKRRNLVIVRQDRDRVEPEERRVDLWWSGDSKNIAFMTAIAHLLLRSERWRNTTLVVKTIVDSSDEEEGAQKKLASFLEESRIDAETEVLVRDGKDVFEMIPLSSQGATIVFLGMRPPAEGESLEAYSRYYQDLLAKTELMPVTALMMAAENVDFEAIFESAAS